MYTVLLFIFIVIAIAMIVLILLQKGSGIGMETSFRTGASSTFFGSSGSANFLTRYIIPFLAILFFLISLIVGNINSHSTKRDDKWQEALRVENFDHQDPSSLPSMKKHVLP
ncbi:Protein-export membrane protein SecG [Candidatus Erwinia haradaeae]|uniref:Protein-export membrane protein SecG n=2 Tax=Candidatus Erwinia haradaeae TaxID=1922217 RepID=A0A803GCT4_9GAMM|nr:Protein-export membrane protein SecG [Candidatus Erwinia haradaeae]